MKECINCKSKNRDTDIYCRNCGCSFQSNSHYVMMNIMIWCVVMGIFGMIVLFIASYLLIPPK